MRPARKILLVNTNRMQPPIAPLGLDYLAEVLHAAGCSVTVLDLGLAEAVEPALARQLGEEEFDLIGLSFRNTDDCYYPGRGWFVPQLGNLLQCIQSRTAAPIVVGGVGFSIMPEAVLQQVGGSLGVAGDGEPALLTLAQPGPEDGADVPGLVRKTANRFCRNPSRMMDLAALPPMSRQWVDNSRYHRLGGQLGFETKRGCAAHCLYCADPLAKGRTVRLRPPQAVAEELAGLAQRGLVDLHACDSEFNRPLEHALAVCEALTARGLGRCLRWYAYCAPTPFNAELAAAMRKAGCVGINFGADSGVDAQLRRLGRDFTAQAIFEAVTCCRRHGLAVMCDLLLGGPGETENTVRQTLELMQRVSPDRIGLSVGVRVYPATPLARLAARQPGALHGPGAAAGDFVAPAFYFSPALGLGIFPLLRELVGNDRRFFFADPTVPGRNYNYNDNAVLLKAIQNGHRGAYWDILRRVSEQQEAG